MAQRVCRKCSNGFASVSHGRICPTCTRARDLEYKARLLTLENATGWYLELLLKQSELKPEERVPQLNYREALARATSGGLSVGQLGSLRRHGLISVEETGVLEKGHVTFLYSGADIDLAAEVYRVWQKGRPNRRKAS